MSSEAAQADHEAGGHPDGHLHRLVFLTDGVFAIAITLMAIEIRPPHDWDGVAAHLFATMWPTLLAYALSFAVIGVYWLSHRRTFARLQRADGVLSVLNFAGLGLIALIPAATGLLYENGSPDAVRISLGLVAAIGAANAVAWAYAAFIGRLTPPGLPRGVKVYVLLSNGLLPAAICWLSIAAIAGRQPLAWLGVAALSAVAVIGPRFLPRR